MWVERRMRFLRASTRGEELRFSCGGPTREEIEASKAANAILAVIVVVIVGGIALLCWLTS
jgi:hypothetical protein